MGPKRMRFVRVARTVSDVHVSSDGRVDTPPSPVRWSERQSDSKPKSSAAAARRHQRSHVSPSCPSIMMPTCMAALPVFRHCTIGAMHRASAKRLLLLIPTTTYRTEDFMEAARRLDVDLVVAAERPNVMAGEFPDHLLTIPFDDP